MSEINLWIDSRKHLEDQPKNFSPECEGGCGVIGIAASVKIAGKHLLKPLQQMCNRGNGKGGGIAACGLDPKVLGVSQQVLQEDTLLAIAYLDRKVEKALEKEFIDPLFEIDAALDFPQITNFRQIKGLEIKPPEVRLYFVRVKDKVLEDFRSKHGFERTSKNEIEEEIIFQNSILINRKFYNAKGEMDAFVLSHGKNLLVLKMVGFANDVIEYYELEDFPAHVWIGHHRYPTKGRVWHPGGAHPFIGLNEALVHNGDFANYHSISEYLSQKNIFPHFLTDTEVGALVFDYLARTLKYPLEYAIECLAPTTERDFHLLPEDKQTIYKALQQIHIHSSPDGPWFFLIAQSKQTLNPEFRLIGITDTSMLRPQVFALQEGEATIGFAASEKQGIDAALESLAAEDNRFWEVADRYWNARGGSYTDGGAFQFTVYPEKDGTAQMICSDKFGRPITILENEKEDRTWPAISKQSMKDFAHVTYEELILLVKQEMARWNYSDLSAFLSSLVFGKKPMTALRILTHLIDYPHFSEHLRRSKALSLFLDTLSKVVEQIGEEPSSEEFAFLHPFQGELKPKSEAQVLIVDAKSFPVDGKDSLAEQLIQMYHAGFKHFFIINCKGHRFLANGLGAKSKGVRFDIFGSSGDYLSSGIDGAEVVVHGNAQDQVGQIMKDGKLVIYGDVGQTFLYAAKGGKAFVLGNAAGRPLINAVGAPRVIINGTCLDYLAESFMAGNPLEGGGFVLINAICFGKNGEIVELESPYPGSNLFSLPSGGAIYMRDPENKVSPEQLNGGEIVELANRDWNLIKPYLEENEALFNIPISRLLQYNGRALEPNKIFRKIRPASLRVLEPEEAWVMKSSSKNKC